MRFRSLQMPPDASRCLLDACSASTCLPDASRCFHVPPVQKARLVYIRHGSECQKQAGATCLASSFENVLRVDATPAQGEQPELCGEPRRGGSQSVDVVRKGLEFSLSSASSCCQMLPRCLQILPDVSQIPPDASRCFQASQASHASSSRGRHRQEAGFRSGRVNVFFGRRRRDLWKNSFAFLHCVKKRVTNKVRKALTSKA